MNMFKFTQKKGIKLKTFPHISRANGNNLKAKVKVKIYYYMITPLLLLSLNYLIINRYKTCL